MTNDELLAAWLDYYRAGHRSAGTIRVRRCHLRQFATWFDAPLTTATMTDVAGFMGSRSHLGVESQVSLRASLRSFFGWAVEAGHIPASPAARLPSIRRPRTVPRPVPEDVLMAAMAAADDETRLILALGAYAGLRRNEIATLHRDNVTVTHLRVTGKGGRTRSVPLHPVLRGLLDAWPETGYIFPSPLRAGRPVGPDYVARRVEVALPDGYTAHKLRHRFATQAYRGTRDLFAVQRLLGHSNPETTQRYVLMDEDSMLAAVLTIQ